MRVAVREVKTDAQFAEIVPLVRLSSPTLSVTDIKHLLREMRLRGYRCVGAYVGKKLVGITGFHLITRFWCGRSIDLDNVIVLEAFRGKGIGEKMMQWVEAEGKRLGCTLAVLDTYATYAKAHKFYFARGYHIEGYHMIKELSKTPISRITR